MCVIAVNDRSVVVGKINVCSGMEVIVIYGELVFECIQ